MNKKGICLNTGRTHFNKVHIPWNKGKKMPLTKKVLVAYKLRKGRKNPKPNNFSEIMRKINPPLGKKKKFSSKDKEKRLRLWRDGYVCIYKPEYPSSRKSPPDYGYILEHRMIIESDIGRQLQKGEVIHHIDGCKSNNKLENLLLCSTQREHNEIHTQMEIFVERLIRKGKVYYDKEKKEFKFR